MEANGCQVEATAATSDTVIPHCAGCSDDPLGELNEIKRMAEEKRRDYTVVEDVLDGAPDGNDKNAVLRLADIDEHNHPDDLKDKNPKKVEVEFLGVNDRTKLWRMGFSVFIAITLHNVPEGLATFFASLADAQIGGLLATAIAIHNLPLGVCISFPMYYATGQRWKGFLSGFLLGLTQPLAALLGWLLLLIDSSVSDKKYGIMFGVMSGLTLMIALKEMLPTAHKYDPEDSVVTYSLLVGLGILALTLVFFEVMA